MLSKNSFLNKFSVTRRYAQHCAPCPYCGKAVYFIDESQFVTCVGCHRSLRVSNGRLMG